MANTPNSLQSAWEQDDAAFSTTRLAAANPGAEVVARTKRKPRLIAHPRFNIGREARADVLARTLGEGARLLVHGYPGVGKSTFTRAIGAHAAVRGRFADQRWFVELAKASDGTAFWVAIAAAMGLPSGVPKDEIKVRLNDGRPRLLVLDNLETPLDHEPVAIRAALAELVEIGALTIIGSVRGRGAPADVVWTREELLPLDISASIRVFQAYAPRAVHDDDPVLIGFARELGGLPLALLLVALRLADSDLVTLWEDWQQIGVEVAQAYPGATDVSHSLASSIELSLRSPAITDAGRHLYKLMGHLPAGLELSDSRKLLGDRSPRGRHELQHVGLINAENRRLLMLPPIRDHASRMAPPEGFDAEGWIEAFLERARSLGERIGRQHGVEAKQVLEREVGNIEAAFRSATAHGGAPLEWAARAITGFARMARQTGMGSPATMELLADSLKAGRRDGDAGHAEIAAAEIYSLRSDDAKAWAAFGRAQNLLAGVQDQVGLGLCDLWQGDFHSEKSEYEPARAAYESAERRFDGRDAELKAASLGGRGRVAFEQADFATAEQLYAKVFKIYRSTENFAGMAGMLYRLGEVARAFAQNDRRTASPEEVARQHVKALRHYRHCRNLATRYGLPLTEANAIKGEGDIHFLREELDLAKLKYAEALEKYSAQSAQNNKGNAERGLGDVAELAESPSEAYYWWCKALETYRIPLKPDCDSVATIHWRLARLSRGRYRRAHAWLARINYARIGRRDLIGLMMLESVRWPDAAGGRGARFRG